jgi:hypothetical protein
MCDYSLHTFPNRLAVDGEELVVHRFGGASLGLASATDVAPATPATRCNGARGKFWSWPGLKEWFRAQQPKWEAERRIPAVCVPPGATIILKDIPKSLQRELGVLETEEVRFVQTSAEVNTYRDAVRFNNGRQVLLQALREGQRAMVLSLGASELEPAPEEIFLHAER